MPVKEDLINWVITNKDELIDSENDMVFVKFKAGEAAADIGCNLASANNALSALKKDGLVDNPERGWWAWTGKYPETVEKAPRKRSKAPAKDPLASAVETITKALEKASERIAKATAESEKVQARADALWQEISELRSEEETLLAALAALDRK